MTRLETKGDQIGPFRFDSVFFVEFFVQMFFALWKLRSYTLDGRYAFISGSQASRSGVSY